MQKQKTQPLSKETIESLQRLGGILMKITHRLVREGKAKIVDEKIIWNNQTAPSPDTLSVPSLSEKLRHHKQ